MAKSRRRRSRSRSSTPRSDRHRRSRSRERDRERRRRYSSSDSDSSSDYEWRSRRQAERQASRRRGRSRSRSRSRERQRRLERSRMDSPRRRSPVKEMKESKGSDVAKEIPGYKDMTPAERVKARMKIMLERASARSQSSKEGGAEGVVSAPNQAPTPPLPSDAQLEAVESEDFTPQRFKSRRTVKKPEPTSVSEPLEVPADVLSKSHEEAMFGSQLPPKPSEPTLASLGIQIIDPVASMAAFSGKKTNKVETEEERNSRWIEKLKQLRSTHKPPTAISRH